MGVATCVSYRGRALKGRSRQGGTMPERAYEFREVSYEFADALASQRAAVLLHYYTDLRIGDVAAVMGTISTSAKALSMRARRRLRTVLGDTDV